MSPWIRPAQGLLDDRAAEITKVRKDIYACNLTLYGRGTAVQRIVHLAQGFLLLPFCLIQFKVFFNQLVVIVLLRNNLVP